VRARNGGGVTGTYPSDFLVKRIDDDAFLHKTPVLTRTYLKIADCCPSDINVE
jgi:hypothetical protein